MQLLNDAKNEVEAMRPWEILKYEQSYSVPSGYSYSTSLGSLPTNFSLDLRVVENDGYPEYRKVALDDRNNRVNGSSAYFLNLAANTFHISGQNHSSKTVYLYYTKYSDDITPSTSWSFPTTFHNLLPLKMAQLYYASDAGEKSRSWDDRWSLEFSQTLNRAILWDEQLKSRNHLSPRYGNWQNPKAVY